MKNTASVVPLPVAGATRARAGKSCCQNCQLRTTCLPAILQGAEVEKLDRIVWHDRQLRRGQHVYRENDRFKAIYVVRSGTLKGYRTSAGGDEEVVGFYYPGDMFAIDSIGVGLCASSALALERAEVCEIPFAPLCALSASVPALQQQLLRLIGREFARSQHLLSLIRHNSAEQRVAALLLSICRRCGQRELSPQRFTLAMTRADIGNYLGLALESVSRVLSHLQHTGIIGIDNRTIALLDPERLGCLSGAGVEVV